MHENRHFPSYRKRRHEVENHVHYVTLGSCCKMARNHRVTNLERFPVQICKDEAATPLSVVGPLFISSLFHLFRALLVGSGSLSSPMREHRNFAQFYCISVTNFSSLWMYPLGNYMNKKNVFFAFLWLFLCLYAMYLEKSPVDFLQEVFAVCPVPVTWSETWTKTVDVFIRSVFIHSVKKQYALYTAICGITGSEIECWFQRDVYKHLF